MIACALCQHVSAANAPKFELDKAWPKIPANMKLGDASSIAIDAQDNVWVLHRPRTLQGDAAKQAAPAIMIFDNAGNYLRSWGGQGNDSAGFEWPQREHGIHIDYKGNLYVAQTNRGLQKLVYKGMGPVSTK